MGDFNMPSINWAEESKPNGESIEAISGEILQEHMEKQFLCNMIKSPTRGSNILDLIFTNSDDILSEIDKSDALNNQYSSVWSQPDENFLVKHSRMFFSACDECVN